MTGKKLTEILEHLNLVSISIPVGVIAASAIFPLQPVIRQAFIGILLVWFGIEAISGFEFWR